VYVVIAVCVCADCCLCVLMAICTPPLSEVGKISGLVICKVDLFASFCVRNKGNLVMW